MDCNQKKRFIKRGCLLLFLFTFVFGSTLCIKADTTIKTVTVSSSTSGDWEGGTVHLPEFRTPKGCELDVQWTSSESSVAPGKKANAELVLTAEDGYQFASNVSIKVNNAEITSKTISNSEIILKIKVGPLNYKLATPKEIAWSSEKSSIVKWSSVKYATSYRVKVYQDNKVVKTETVTSRSYDAGKYFNGESEVLVSVTALGTGNSDSKYIKQSDEAFVDGAEVDWDDKESTYGYWEGKRYRLTEKDDDKEYARGWIEIFGKWYYFDQNYNLKTGWIDDNGMRYYADSDGVMQVGWQQTKDSDAWYYFRTSGEMATGWVGSSSPGTWYYMGEDGTMKTGWVQDNGKWYFMGPDGKGQKGWQSINERWYYFHEDGHMASAETVDSYYINADGVWVP